MIGSSLLVSTLTIYSPSLTTSLPPLLNMKLMLEIQYPFEIVVAPNGTFAATSQFFLVINLGASTR